MRTFFLDNETLVINIIPNFANDNAYMIKINIIY